MKATTPFPSLWVLVLAGLCGCSSPHHPVKVTPLPGSSVAPATVPPGATPNRVSSAPPAGAATSAGPSGTTATHAPSSVAPPSNPKHLTEAQATEQATRLVKEKGINLQAYQPAQAMYDADQKEWTVWFFLKPPIPPGGYVYVVIHEQTGKAELLHGE